MASSENADTSRTRDSQLINLHDPPEAKRRRLGQSPPHGASTTADGLRWPMGQLPVEIFAQITSYLDRCTLQAMRLVCREFELKVAAEYFKHVVVAFRPEIYSSFENNGQLSIEKDLKTDKGRLLARGMRVFRDFGCYMRAFALVLELSEGELAYPPIKCTQKAVTSFWGIYRWPQENYTRYGQLEFTEELADEPDHLSTALSFLTDLQELGLSCDAGLGFLRGPDVNDSYPIRLGKVLRRSRHEPNFAPTLDDAFAKNALRVEEGKTLTYAILKKMVMDEGYEGDQVAEAIDIMMQNEFPPDTSLTNATVPANISPELGIWIREALRQTQAHDFAQPQPPGLPSEPTPALEQSASSAGLTASDCSRFPKSLVPAHLSNSQLELLLELEWAQRALIQSYAITIMDSSTRGTFKHLASLTIARIAASHVCNLNRAAFWEALPSLKAIFIGVIPDWRKLEKGGRYSNITETKKQPSESSVPVFHLLQTCGLHAPTVKSLHFEWVGGGELAPGVSQRDRYVLPAPFYSNRTMMVSERPPTTRDESIWLPHVENLSLKNCWFTPHAFVQVVRTLSRQCALKSLDLETVSLTGAPTTQLQPLIKPPVRNGADHHPWPLCAGARPGTQFILDPPLLGLVQPPLAMGPLLFHPQLGFNQLPPNHPLLQAAPAPHGANNAAGGQDGGGGATAASAAGANSVVFDGPLPDLFSWAHVIDELTPGRTILESVPGLRHNAEVASEFALQREQMLRFVAAVPLADKDKDIDEPPHAVDSGFMSGSIPRSRRGDRCGSLVSMTFKSCGYVLADMVQLRNWDLIPDRPVMVPQTEETARRLRELDDAMQSTADPLAATVLPHLRSRDASLLQSVFGMRFGWGHGVYDADVVRAAHLDGNPIAGQGRFSGRCVGRRGWLTDPTLPDPDDDYIWGDDWRAYLLG